MKNPKEIIEDTFEPIRRKRLHGAHVRKMLRRRLPCCNGKNSYHTSREAEEVRQTNLASGRVSYLRVYRCPHCFHWHLTSKQPKKHT
jgi:hypothetical protein